MKAKLLAPFVLAPMGIGVVVSVAIVSTTVASQNYKVSKNDSSNQSAPKVLNTYEKVEVTGDLIKFFNGSMPLSDEQIKFINDNNNGVTLQELNEKYVMNGKPLITKKVKTEIIDNYYTKGFFNQKQLEFQAYGKRISYPLEAQKIIVNGDEETFIKANKKVIELWKLKKFTFPWEAKKFSLATKKTQTTNVKKPSIKPKKPRSNRPLSVGQLKYYNNQFPLSPTQIEYVDSNNGEWTIAKIREAASQSKPSYATKTVSDMIIGNYFKEAEISFFKDSISKVVWNNKEIDYPSSVLTKTTPRARAEEIIKLWKAGIFKFPWETGAVTKPYVPTSTTNPTKPKPAKPKKPVVPVPTADGFLKLSAAMGKTVDGTYLLSPELIQYINDNNEQKYASMNGAKRAEIKILESVWQKVETDYKAMFPKTITSKLKSLTLTYKGIKTTLSDADWALIKKSKGKDNYWTTISKLARAGKITIPWYTKA